MECAEFVDLYKKGSSIAQSMAVDCLNSKSVITCIIDNDDVAYISCTPINVKIAFRLVSLLLSWMAKEFGLGCLAAVKKIIQIIEEEK